MRFFRDEPTESACSHVSGIFIKKRRFLLFSALLLILSLSVYCPNAYADNNMVLNVRDSVVRVVELFFVDGEYMGGGHGTGIVVGDESNPYVLTNRHVVDWKETADTLQYEMNTNDVTVQVYILQGEHSLQSISLTGNNIIMSSTDDLALIKVPSKLNNKVPAKLGSSSDVNVTDLVYAIGFPAVAEAITDKTGFDTSNIETALIQSYPSETDDMTVSRGTVSKTGVKIEGGVYIQHEVNIAPGNSGGPLVDENGHVIGINTLLSMDRDSVSKVSYSIDVDSAKQFLKKNNVPFSEGTKLGGTARRYLKWIIAAMVLLFIALYFLKKQLRLVPSPINGPQPPGPSPRPTPPKTISEALTRIYSSPNSDKLRLLTDPDFFVEQLAKQYQPAFKRDCQLLEKASRGGLGKIIIQYQNQNAIPGNSDKLKIRSELVKHCGFTEDEASRAISLYFDMVGWDGSVPAGTSAPDLSNTLKVMYQSSDKSRILSDPDYFVEMLARNYRPEFKTDCQLLEKASRSGLGSIIKQYLQQGAEPTNSELEMLVSELCNRCGFSREDARRAISLYGSMVGWSRY